MRLKIGVIGSSKSGKSCLTNVLRNEGVKDDAALTRVPYRETNSVRIIELNLANVELKKFNAEVDVQLWEIGGNPKLKTIWPGVQSEMDGLIIVYDANKETHIQDASTLHMHFVTHTDSGLSPQQCFFVGNLFRGMREQGPPKILGSSQRSRNIALNIADDSAELRKEFRQFITTVAQIVYEQERTARAGYKEKKIPYSSTRMTKDDTIRENNAKKEKSKNRRLKPESKGGEFLI